MPSLRRVISAGAPVPGARHRAVRQVARPRRAGLHALRGDRSAAGGSIGSDEILGETRCADGAGQGRLRRPAGPRRWTSASSASATSRSRRRSRPCLAAGRGRRDRRARAGRDARRTSTGRSRRPLAKIVRRGRRIWHRMGDLGYLDEQGRLWFCGRKSHRVVTPGGTRSPIPCEGVFNAHPAVYRTALVGVTRPGVVEPVLCVELRTPPAGAPAALDMRSRDCWRSARRSSTRGLSRRSCSTGASRWTCGTTPRSSARSWPRGRPAALADPRASARRPLRGGA